MSKRTVAFFSAGGTTKRVAATVAKAAGAELFEIVPDKRYSQADLNWSNDRSRSSVEMKNKSIRPAIAENCRLENMAEVEVLFVGFPIWWYVAPTIINSFLEQYNLHGKKIVLFATSGGSGMGNAMQELKLSAPGAEFVGEKRLPANVSEADVRSWLDTLDI